MTRRAQGVKLPSWWIHRLNQAVRESGLSQTELTHRLQVVAGSRKWDRSTLSRFLAGEHTTIELADVLSAYFCVARPVHIAASEAEAEAFEAIVRLRGKRER